MRGGGENSVVNEQVGDPAERFFGGCGKPLLRCEDSMTAAGGSGHDQRWAFVFNGARGDEMSDRGRALCRFWGGPA